MSDLTQEQQLSQLLAVELKESHQLLNILIEEHQALSSSDPDMISSITAKKLDAVECVELHHIRGRQFLVSIGLSSSSEAIEAFIQRLPKESRVSNQWQELQNLAKALHRQNEINGGVIALTQRHITLALDILSGKMRVTATYGRSGQAHSEAIPQHLAKA